MAMSCHTWYSQSVGFHSVWPTMVATTRYTSIALYPLIGSDACQSFSPFA